MDPNQSMFFPSSIMPDTRFSIAHISNKEIIVKLSLKK
jgi:hypothetical protein